MRRSCPKRLRTISKAVQRLKTPGGENCCEIPLNYTCLFYLPIDFSSRHVVCSLPPKLLYRHHWVIGSLASTHKPSPLTHRKARRMSQPKVLPRVILILCGIAIGSFLALTAFSNKTPVPAKSC